MNPTNTLESSKIGINVHLLSFSFNKYLIKHDVRGIIMTYPETEKQEFIIKSKDIQFPNHLVTLNISKDAQMIFIFFQKKNQISKDQFMAWTVINMSHLPEDPHFYDYTKCGTLSGEIKLLDIYEYYLLEKENDRKLTLTERSFQKVQEVNGQIEVQITMTEEFDLNEKRKHSKVYKNKSNDNFKKNKSNDHFNKKKKIEITQVCDLDNDEEDNSLIPLKEKKSDKKFHKKSKCSKDYINIE